MKKICMILVLCLMATFAYGQGKGNSDRILIIAAGPDEDIPGATTFIKAEIKLNEDGQLPSGLGQVKFGTKIHDGLGGLVYTMEGYLEGAMMVMFPAPPSYCEVREVWWINRWIVMGMGKVKTTGTLTMIDYRGVEITLPNTEGEWRDELIIMSVSTEGKYTLEEGSEEYFYYGGWAWAGIQTPPESGYPMFGGITWLRNFLDKRVP